METAAPIVLAVGVLFTSIASAYVAVVTALAKISADKALALAVSTKVVADETKKVADATHDAVNSKMEQLLDVVKTSSRAEGVIEGKAIEKAKTSNG